MMIKFYLNRELSDRLNIKLSRWKRWSREFLPPDPLGGMQSGYARQYTLEQAFTVFLGGHLVADLHFSMPEAKQILADLHAWINKQACFPSENGDGYSAMLKRHRLDNRLVYIFKQLSPNRVGIVFSYTERIRISDEEYRCGETAARREVYSERPISIVSAGETIEKMGKLEKIDSKILYIRQLQERFFKKLTSK